MEVRGTPLSEEDFEKKKIIFAWDRPQLRYAWDTGVAVGRFLAELKNGRIVARYCAGCQRTMVPPRMFCELCWRPTDEWRFAKDTGIVNTFSLCYVTWDMKQLKDPEIPIVVELDGASPGMGFLHKLGEVDPKKVRTGMKIKALWKPAKDRVGSILDIKYFVPAK